MFQDPISPWLAAMARSSRFRTLRSLTSLLSLATSQAALLPGGATATRRASSLSSVVAGRGSRSAVAAAAPSARAAATQMLATCDRRTQSCRLSGVTDGSPASWSRSDAPRMQQVACPAPAAADEEMATQYASGEVEERLYKWWEESGYFKPGGDETKQCFVIPMPPPNVTGKLHMGHAMFVTLEDIMARFHRMRGRPTLWLPGTDHAGIATQMLVERQLKSQGIERVELGREKFLERVWEWKGEYGGFITEQMRRLGASCDWSREKFTLDDDLCAAVAEAFVQLHEKGLIYRGEYMVNWSPTLGTAVSDLEVDYVDEQGKLYYFKYMLADSEGGEHIPVATTRPETILGDAAVCVHPEDERYKHLVGREVLVPMLNKRIPVIADDYVQMDFGSGALKITPAHDVNDYAIGKRQNLPIVNIMNKDATLNEVAGPDYEGLDRYDCRTKLWADMEGAGLTIKVEDHTQRVPRSERSGEVIEPMVSTQWFVSMRGMADKGLAAVRSGETQILPERFEKTYFQWLDNIQDWCISRQLWWGHRIPVWHADAHNKYFVARDEAEAQAKADAELGAGVVLRQDPDVLDTWFSSGLWPFATVGWPQQTGDDAKQLPADPLSDFARFYPASVMETGYDILFFWVARMMMLGIELTGKPPFHTIYMHGLVRDGKGQKMSKTKGNVVDPIETIDGYGTDALRLSLVTGVTPGQDVPLSMDKVTANRNFANKLWNTGRFLIMGLKELPADERQALAVTGPMGADELASLPLPERYIVSRVHGLVGEVTDQLEAYDFGPAGMSIYSFLWDEYADWYIEISKRRIAGGDPLAAAQARRTLVYVLDACLRLLHPFMPYITEELWQRLPHDGPALIVAPWPQLDEAPPLPVDAAAVAQFESMQGVVRAIRNARAEYKVEPGKKVAATVAVSSAALAGDLIAEADALAMLARVHLDGFTVIEDALQGGAVAAEAPADSVRLVVQEGLEAYLPLADLMDPVKERARLAKQQAKLQTDIDKLATRLDPASGFADKAPAAVVEKATSELAEFRERLASVEDSLSKLPPA